MNLPVSNPVTLLDITIGGHVLKVRKPKYKDSSFIKTVLDQTEKSATDMAIEFIAYFMSGYESTVEQNLSWLKENLEFENIQEMVKQSEDAVYAIGIAVKDIEPPKKKL